MSVLLDTTLGEVVLDLYPEACPTAAKNFLKLCKCKYYNNNLFFNVQQNFLIQSGDPTGERCCVGGGWGFSRVMQHHSRSMSSSGTGKGGMSVYGLLYGDQVRTLPPEMCSCSPWVGGQLEPTWSRGGAASQARFFEDEIRQDKKHNKAGLLCMASAGENQNASQFYITMRGEDLEVRQGWMDTMAAGWGLGS